jgi:glycosyltransferase involved in cell wall biosynthesis
VALANGLSQYLPVTLVPLKPCKEEHLIIDPDVEVVSLASYRDWRKKYKIYRDMLIRFGGRSGVVSISFCFSADCFNAFMSNHAAIISSVRGNLLRNYRFGYGWPGLIAALLHFVVLQRFDRVVAMSKSMTRQLERFGIFDSVQIGNFIDENSLNVFRMNERKKRKKVQFVYLASLTNRKRPDLLIDSARILHNGGVKFKLDILGDGPLRPLLEKRVKELNLTPFVTFYGHVSSPYEILQQADYMILPSESEGIARSALEALFFGVKCILRDVDGVNEIIMPGYNGYLFKEDNELVEILENVARDHCADVKGNRKNLLPPEFRQKSNIEAMLNLIGYE